jgi:hypothetical protein
MAEIRASHGSLVFFLTCAGVEPYLEGYRVTVNIGKPYVAELADVSLKLAYGKDVAESLREDRKVTVHLPSPLASGALTPVVFIINPASTAQLRHMPLLAGKQLPGEPGWNRRWLLLPVLRRGDAFRRLHQQRGGYIYPG